MRIGYFGVYDQAYPRNAILRRGLESAGAEVVDCRVPPELGPSHMRGDHPGRGISGRLAFEAREARLLVQRLRRLGRRAAEIGPVDAVIVAEFAQGLVPVARRWARRHDALLVVDFLVSLYETAVVDRRALPPRSPRAVFRSAADHIAIRQADLLLMEMSASRDQWERRWGGVRDKSVVIPIGVAEWHFVSAPLRTPWNPPFTVLWFGSYIPLHGVSTILEAAHVLRDDDRFQFRLVGTGQEHAAMRNRYEICPSGNVAFLPWLDPDQLLAELHASDICLGIFGTSAKSRRTVPNKVFQCMATGRPVITGDGEGPETLLAHGSDCLLVPSGDGRALAAALTRLASDPDLAHRLAGRGAALVHDRYSSHALGASLLEAIRERREACRTGRRE